MWADFQALETSLVGVQSLNRKHWRT